MLPARVVPGLLTWPVETSLWALTLRRPFAGVAHEAAPASPFPQTGPATVPAVKSRRADAGGARAVRGSMGESHARAADLPDADRGMGIRAEALVFLRPHGIRRRASKAPPLTECARC